MAERVPVLERYLRFVTGDANLVLGTNSSVRELTMLISRWSNPMSRTARGKILAAAPKMYGWLERCHLRFVKSYFAPHYGLSAPEKWPKSVAFSWGLEIPPSPGACVAGFVSPKVRVGSMREVGTALDDLDADILRLWLGGYNAYEMASDLGHGRDCGFITTAMSRAVLAIMERPDYICWALHPDPSTLPEPLSAGWYERNRDWYMGQLAIGRPYIYGEQRALASGAKNTRWPTPGQLAKLDRGEVWQPPVYRRPPLRPAQRGVWTDPNLIASLGLDYPAVERLRQEKHLQLVRKRHALYLKKREAALSKLMKSKSSSSTSRSGSSTTRSRRRKRKRSKASAKGRSSRSRRGGS